MSRHGIVLEIYSFKRIQDSLDRKEAEVKERLRARQNAAAAGVSPTPPPTTDTTAANSDVC